MTIITLKFRYRKNDEEYIIWNKNKTKVSQYVFFLNLFNKFIGTICYYTYKL